MASFSVTAQYPLHGAWFTGWALQLPAGLNSPGIATTWNYWKIMHALWRSYLIHSAAMLLPEGVPHTPLLYVHLLRLLCGHCKLISSSTSYTQLHCCYCLPANHRVVQQWLKYYVKLLLEGVPPTPLYYTAVHYCYLKGPKITTISW